MKQMLQSGATDGQAMVWSNGNGQWEPVTIRGGDVVEYYAS